MNKIKPLHLIVGGSALAILGLFLPWLSISIDFGSGKVSMGSALGVNDTMGAVILLLSAAVIGLYFANIPAGKRKLFSTITLGAAGGAALLTLIQLIRIFSNSSWSPSVGGFISLIGTAAAAYGCFLSWQKVPADPVTSSPSSAQPPPAA